MLLLAIVFVAMMLVAHVIVVAVVLVHGWVHVMATGG